MLLLLCRHPSKEGHRIMADYVEEVLRRCVEADA